MQKETKLGKMVKSKNVDYFRTPEEAKTACKSRKRKERQESVSSICNERKFIRSSSEERATSRKHLERNTSMRRVFSSEDFRNEKNNLAKSLSHENVTITCFSRAESRDIGFILEEYEHEKRRTTERFSKPVTFKYKKNYATKKRKDKSFPKSSSKSKIDKFSERHVTKHYYLNNNNQEFEDREDSTISGECAVYITKKLENDLQLETKTEGDKSCSPAETPSSPSFDLSSLQEPEDCEPVPSCSNFRVDENIETLPGTSVASTHMLSSPRNSLIATHRIYLDPDVVYRNIQMTLNPVEQRLRKLSKQINSIKKKIKKCENEFVAKNGSKPEKNEKIKDEMINQYYTELNKLKKEYRLLQGPSTFRSKSQEETNPGLTLKEILLETEMKLCKKREFGSRGDNIDEMTPEQLVDEKIALQKALLHLESLYGRPTDKDDRDLVRPLYDRYRTLKRTLFRISTSTNNTNDLATIHEDETATFTIGTPKRCDSPAERPTTLNCKINTNIEPDVSVNENFYSMTQNELQEEIRIAVEKKKAYKKLIKEYEMEILQETGKMLQKDDKLPMYQLYKNYKKVKAKLRLLDALVAKQK